ncbi:cell division protein MraZ [Mycoplasma ovis str. Michigan]|uniref:Transcriptional regulator MraZ n=1 Tax=Mycoplasma ovis str. Michigan TaxID=1415773 RepID=A0ABM5P0Y1_9MOLU|nr:cell division protein MraZ [Mycoplasma ovis]AHC39991.1 cell division protein MraZ [Mycoplasma ovis str. Michigan]
MSVFNKTKKDETAFPVKSTVYRYFFSGTYIERVDGKNRVFIPLTWRHIFKDKLIITKNEVGCLTVWTPGFFQWFAYSRMDACSSEQEKNIVRRMFIGSATTLYVDPKARVTLPHDLLSSLAHQDGALYFVGAGDYVEIWSKSLFESWRSKQMPKDMKHEEL